ncbi:MAG: hypothetical protein JWL84_325 [Rhodospirillales bacterium]|jgi:hypothetical protein|nr:hypothetical protein [Rhodospirillales bacterium]
MSRPPKPRRPTRRGRKRIIPLDPLAIEIFEDAEREFVKKFGRAPGPNDPVFFDPDEDTPQPIPVQKMHAVMLITMIRAKVDHALIYAYIRTGGLIVTKASFKKLPPQDQGVWNQAMEEYEEKFGNR